MTRFEEFGSALGAGTCSGLSVRLVTVKVRTVGKLRISVMLARFAMLACRMDMRVDMRIDEGVDMCIDIRIDMRTDMHRGVRRTCTETWTWTCA